MHRPAEGARIALASTLSSPYCSPAIVVASIREPLVMEARIYRPARTAMQSGRANTRLWRLEFEPDSARHLDSLMGWTGSSDMNGQVNLDFESREAAIAYCERHAIPYRVRMPQEARPRAKSYADNFRYDKVE